MSPYLIVTIQFTLGLIIFATVGRQYLLGRLRRSDAFAAVAPVLLVHGFRFLGLTFLAPDQVAPAQDIEALALIAFGDLSAAVAGIVAALAAFRRSAWTVPLAWLFTVVGLGDLAMVGSVVANAGTLGYGIGAMWLTCGLLAPLLVLSHAYVVYALVWRRAELLASRA